MLRRCVVRPPICARSYLPRRSCAFRFQSTTLEKKPPALLASDSSHPNRDPNSRKWHLFAIMGLIGFTVGSWYRLSKKWQAIHDPWKFQEVELLAKQAVSSTASIFTIKPKGELAEEYGQAWEAGIWSVEFKQPQLQIVRAYTPLPPVLGVDAMAEDDDMQSLRFFIRQDSRGGEMSSYLHRLPLGATIELRGPNIEYPIDHSTNHVIFVAGGTGIAPALQVAHAMFDGLSRAEKKEKTLHILWANRRVEDARGGAKQNEPVPSEAVESGISSWAWSVFGARAVKDTSQPQVRTAERKDSKEDQNLIVQQLNALKAEHADSIKVSFFVDEQKSYVTSTTLEHALSALPYSRPAKKKSNNDTQIIVSGPPGFITYIAGSKVWKDGKERQGPIGGCLAQVLGKVGRTDITVWKV